MLTRYRYSFCRVADDLVDNAEAEEEASDWITKLAGYLSMAYASKETRIISDIPDIHSYISSNFPQACHSALCLLPTHLLSFGPLYDLLEGFRTDLKFHARSNVFPIETEHDLEVYATRVAATISELCLELVFHHSYTANHISDQQRQESILSGSRMGIALQYVNIARDIARDSVIGRVYLPITWLKEAGLTPEDVIENPGSLAVEWLRARLLDKAFEEYRSARISIAGLPSDVRGPLRVAVESYMEIGRVLREKNFVVKDGKATVSKLRRLRVGWLALSEG